MPRGAATTVDNNFTRGLVTEFTAMNFPENAVTEGDNCVYSEQGFVRRRLGMNFEDDFTRHTISSITTTPSCYSEYIWNSVNNISTVSFVVQQVGNQLLFFTESSTAASLSAGRKSFQINLTTFAAPGAAQATISAIPCQYTSGRGYLVVAHPYCDPFYVTYASDTDTITSTRIVLSVRDFERLDDGLEIDERPTTLTDLHKYNLYNQGWNTDTRAFMSTSDRPIMDALVYWDYWRSDWPSNADIFWAFRSAEGDINYGEFDRTYVGNSPAGNGHYIYEALNVNRTAKSGIPGLPTDTAGSARPSAVVFYAGRAFFAGVNANKFSDKVYFTQIIDIDDKFGKCFQQNDPTAESLSDLLDSDGGVIALPLIETIVSMKVIGDSLVVLATNGCYTISGTQQGPFKATDYTISYISSIGGTSHLSVIEVDGGLMWWNTDGIYALTRDNVGAFQVTNVSKPTIQTLINSIPSVNRRFVKGSYNRKDQLVQWLFSGDDDITGFEYNRILEFNVVSKAFYTYTIDTTLGPRLSGLFTTSGQTESLSPEDVSIIAGSTVDLVTDNALAQVTINVSEFSPNSEVFKYTTTKATSGTNTLTYSEIRDLTYVDWKIYNSVGVAYSSYGISGYRVRGEFLRPFNSTPILFVAENVDSGRCLVSGIWDYGFRQSTTQELYIVRPEVDYLLRRIKLRGKGRSLQIKFASVGNNPFSLVGWSTFDTGGQVP